MNAKPGISRAFRTLPTIRRGLLRNIVLLILVTGAAMVTVVVVEAYRTVAALSESLIEIATAQTATRLGGFFEPVTQNLLVARGRGRASALDVGSVQALNAIFIPELQQYEQVSSLMIADGTGLEYMLLRSEEDWINRRVAVDRWGTRSEWHRWRSPDELLEEWTAQVEYDPRVRPWYVGAMDHPSAGVHWTEPYTFFTTKDPGITASVRWSPNRDPGTTYVLAFDVLLSDISTLTGELEVGERGTTVVLTEDLRVLGLPRDDRFSDLAAIKASVLLPADSLGVPALTDAIGAWGADGERSEVPIKFASGGETWWAGFRQFPLGDARKLWMGVVVPEADILGPTLQRRNALVGITIVALVLGIGIAVLVDRGYQRRLSTAVSQVKQLGQYTLEEKIGEGGMGSVYRARHAMLRRPTAVKLVRADQSSDEQALSRFEREVQLTASLTHPNTISIYDYGRTPDGIFYYAMEYLNGVTLQDLVDRTGPMPADRTIYILHQIAGSLAEAHAIGLIHRDIKPCNVMLAERGGVHDFVK
ncbi:MAG: protein kinase, partial [Longimicrobiales bacterium]